MENLILKSLAIRNFRAFHDITIEHLGRVNLIVGKNNVGKTSLLEAIRLYASRASTPTFIWEIMNSNEIACIFISSNGLTNRQLIELWDRIALTKLEADVLDALRLIAPGVVNLNFVSSPLSGGERIPMVKIASVDEPLPLYSLGDGMLRTLGMALALVNAREGILLIDEFENGIYYAVQPDIWHLIFRIARRLNVQVVATTHSWDCIEAFQKAAQEGRQDEGLLIRLESKQGDIKATTFDKRQLGTATRERIEVR